MLTTTGSAFIATTLGFNAIASPLPDPPAELPRSTLATGLREAGCSMPPRRASVVGSEWLGSELQIVEVACGRTSAGVMSILFAMPAGQPERGRIIRMQDWRDGRLVGGYRVASPTYDRDSRTLSSTESMGEGDCGTIKEWKWDGWSFRLINVWRKTACDGEAFDWDTRMRWQVFPKPVQVPAPPRALDGTRSSKCPPRCSSQRRIRLGSPATAQIAKYQAQPVASATKPPPDDRYVRPTAASAVSNAYWVAVCSGLRHSADR